MLTPDGTKYDPVDPVDLTTCWIQPGIDGSTSAYQFPNIAKYAADSSKSLYLPNFILMACAAVNKMCNRKFQKQQIDQIWMNQTLFFRDYKTFPLMNKPLVSVDSVWLQVANTFAAIQSTYFQVLTAESIVKVLPTFSVYVQTSLPPYALQSASNLWIRFTSGYDVDYSTGHSTNNVPFDVRMATAMYLDYLYSRFDLSGSVDQFSTQTYSQHIASGENDPLLNSIKQLLKPYIMYSVR